MFVCCLLFGKGTCVSLFYLCAYLLHRRVSSGRPEADSGGSQHCCVRADWGNAGSLSLWLQAGPCHGHLCCGPHTMRGHCQTELQKVSGPWTHCIADNAFAEVMSGLSCLTGCKHSIPAFYDKESQSCYGLSVTMIAVHLSDIL